MSNGNSISGRKKNTAFDFYETPKWATEKNSGKIIDGCSIK